MVIAQDDGERSILFGKDSGFCVADRFDLQGGDAGVAYLRRKLGLPIVVADSTGDNRPPTGVSCSPSEQVNNCSPVARLIDLVDVVDEQGSAPTAAEFVEELVLRHRAADLMSHPKPAARNNPTVTENKDAPLRLKSPRKVFHDRRLADAGRAYNVQGAMRLKRRVGLVNQFGAGKSYTTNLVLDFV
jgi:hypothetical protein